MTNQKIILISGRDYLQAREYAKSKGYNYMDWKFIDDMDKLRGLRGSEVRIEALPGTPHDVFVQAQVQNLEIVDARN